MKQPLIVLFSIIFAVAACQKKDSVRFAEPLTDRTILMRSIELGNIRSNNPINQHFQSFKAVFGKSIMEKSTNEQGSSTWNREEYISCAKYTKEKKDGFQIETWDFGDGCKEFNIFTTGKYTIKWKETSTKHYWEIIYMDYAQTFKHVINIDNKGNTIKSEENKTLIMNGYISSTFDKNDLKYDADKNDYRGIYLSKENINYKWDDKEYICIGSSKTTFNSNTHIVEEGEYDYKEVNGSETYTWNIKSPVVSDYDCENSLIPTKGLEEFIWIDGDKKGEMTLDYGDGTCDNFVRITKNGETETIDYFMYSWREQ